ncbi:hypothetical protein ACE1CD_01510 [Aerosakkonema sp. BLCC-F183]|uniref:hypothetical protein n=1 Tax=Aerosakkonema sp. BLCC-F183 TaxID=3342834 RepID=UPI0035BB2554
MKFISQIQEEQANISGTILKLVQEYYKLAILPHLSEDDAEGMATLLELAVYDDELNFWLKKVDCFVAHELG